ncbi:unnamed protein product [Discula destructiva]
METINKALHPNQPHTEDTTTTAASEIHHESNEGKQPRAGHHHPRQPVGATGPPPNHKPRSHFTGGDGGNSADAEAGLEGGDVGDGGVATKADVAETGNQPSWDESRSGAQC